jgi:hypothetical protein
MNYTPTPKALITMPDEQLLDCFIIAVEMDLDLDFILQLRGEINRRKLGALLHQTRSVS